MNDQHQQPVTSNPSPASCAICGGPLRSDARYGVCNRTRECKKEWGRRRRAAIREKIAQRNRKYYAVNREKIARQKQQHGHGSAPT